MKEILLVGASLSSGNRGVNALTRSQIMLILDNYKNVKINILSYTVRNEVTHTIKYNDKEIIVKEIPCGLKKALEMFFKSIVGLRDDCLNMIKSSFMIWDISEGDSFSDIYGIKRFIQHSLIKLISIKMESNLVIMPQTLGPFNNLFVKKVAKFIINKSKLVFVRDKISENEVVNNLHIKRKVNYCPDLAFYMDPDRSMNINEYIKANDTKVIIGLNISALLYNGGYNKKNMFDFKIDYKDLVDSIIKEFMKKDGVQLILIPHVLIKEFEVEDDFNVCKKIARKFEQEFGYSISTIDTYYREDQLKSIIGQCDYFIGSRMHACIGAVSSNVPTTPISYSRKFIGVWKELGLEDCIADPRFETKEEIIDKILKNYEKRSDIQEKLIEVIPCVKNEISKTIIKIEEEFNEKY